MIFNRHQRHPDFSHLFQLAWSEGLVVVIHTDASGDGGWGVTCGNIWKQGQWTPEELWRSFFEREDFSALTWCFPPKDMIGLLLKFWESKHRAKVTFRIVLLVPESTHAPWWHHLKHFKPLMRFRAQSDLFRELGPDGLWAHRLGYHTLC